MEMTVLTGLAALVALALLGWGWRGRRVGDHPHCRGCGFDLHGCMDNAGTCPECGRDLTMPKATVRGMRQRRIRVLTIGLVLLTVAGIFAGLQAWRHISKATFYAYAPDRYLVWVVDDPDARTELSARLRRGEVDAGLADQLINEALAVQGDLSRPWDVSWGGLIEDAYAAGLVTHAQLARYASQAVTLELRIRPEVQQGREPTANIIPQAPSRIGFNTEIEGSVSLTGFWVDGEAVEVDSRLRREAAGFTIHVAAWSDPLLTKEFAQLGDTSIEAEVAVTLSLSINGHHVSPPIKPPPQRLSSQLVVVEEPTGHYLGDHASLAQRRRTAGVWVEEVPNRPDGRRLVFRVMFGPDEQKIVRAWLRIDGEIVTSGTRYYGGKSWSFEEIHRQHPQLTGATRADLIIRPDIEATETGTTIEPMWLGEWVFEDIPLDADPVAKRPNLHSGTPVPTLVPARVRLLTVEEAERPPAEFATD